jgi:hypothetical protein
LINDGIVWDVRFELFCDDIGLVGIEEIDSSLDFLRRWITEDKEKSVLSLTSTFCCSDCFSTQYKEIFQKTNNFDYHCH